MADAYVYVVVRVQRLQLEVESLDLAMEVGGSRRAPELEQRQERVLELARGFEAFTVAVVKPGGSSVVAAAVGEPGPARHGEEGEGEATAEARRPAEAPVGSGGGKLEDNAEYLLRFDGGSRGNPGPSGAGAVLYKKGPTGWVEVYAQALWLGKLSCNQAEYKGFIAGLQAAKKLGVKVRCAQRRVAAVRWWCGCAVACGACMMYRLGLANWA
jgi:hypothetical protein